MKKNLNIFLFVLKVIASFIFLFVISFFYMCLPSKDGFKYAKNVFNATATGIVALSFVSYTVVNAKILFLEKRTESELSETQTRKNVNNQRKLGLTLALFQICYTCLLLLLTIAYSVFSVINGINTNMVFGVIGMSCVVGISIYKFVKQKNQKDTI